MSLRTTIQKKFQNLFVAVILNDSECVLRCKVLKDGTIKKTFSKTFTLLEQSDTLDKNVENYLIALQDEYAFVYTIFLLNSMGQGAFEGDDFKKFNVDSANVHHLSIKKQWSIYASFIEIKWAKNLFSAVGLDLVYSPFILLNHFVTSQKLKNRPTCYLLNCQDFFILAVFEGEKFHFGAFFKTQHDVAFTHAHTTINDWEHEEQEEGVSNLQQIATILDDVDNAEDLNDFSPMGDLDDLKTSDSFSDLDDTKTLGHFQGIDDVRKEDVSLELYGRDILVYKYLKASLEEYYHNPLYRSEFIEEIIIFDGYEISSELIHQLEDDLMMDVEIHKVDVSDRLCDIAIKEVFQ